VFVLDGDEHYARGGAGRWRTGQSGNVKRSSFFEFFNTLVDDNAEIGERGRSSAKGGSAATSRSSVIVDHLLAQGE